MSKALSPALAPPGVAASAAVPEVARPARSWEGLVPYLLVAPLALVFLAVLRRADGAGRRGLAFRLRDLRDPDPGLHAARTTSTCSPTSVTWVTYLKTLKFCLIVWVITLVLGFAIAYFLAFHIRSLTWQMTLFLLSRSRSGPRNVIRMISWIPLLGRNGLVNTALLATGLVEPAAGMAALLRLRGGPGLRPSLHAVHDRADLQLDDAHRPLADRGGARLPAPRAGRRCGTSSCRCRKPGIAIGSIFVITIVMGDFVTVGVMGGGQIASVGKIDLDPDLATCSSRRPRPTPWCSWSPCS